MIYFAQIGPDGPVKIGCSANVEGRLKHLRSAYGVSLRLLMTMPGDRTEEGAIHARFAHYRLRHSEQFRPGPDLMDHVGHPRTRDWESVKEVRTNRPTQFRLTAAELATAHQLKREFGLVSLSATIKYAIKHMEDHHDRCEKFRESGE